MTREFRNKLACRCDDKIRNALARAIVTKFVYIKVLGVVIFARFFVDIYYIISAPIRYI